ncbi:molybdate ABC transporter substrate-binding protein [Microbacterium sp. cf332]|uniref:molybdate ABC transporter substrate-binding protein n=1 Tax=Microbacterium sp. cf332 TaxID=1761804 RepID=UPI00088759FE|nr:molybdate ABC transporter substrate-binding protein [Microbacterium sp. cf332]SDQ23887.1 molybdate transport system substrate-binding protein [Microbacterium sp. cf332]
MRRHPLSFAALAAALLVVTGCAAGGGPDIGADATPGAVVTGPGSPEPDVSGEVNVFAAASLKDGFDELATQFEQRHPSVSVAPISYDGSSTLATQLIEGAPADVFASADEANMQKVVDAGLTASPQLFATNRLTIVVPAGNPAGITGLADLADADRTVVLCAAEVPCGAASTTLLENAGVTPSVDSYEQNVTAVLTKVTSGEADAGLVYVTDAATTDEVDAVETPGADAVVNRYPIAALTAARSPEAAAAFVAFVLSDEGRAVLDQRGFGAP